MSFLCEEGLISHISLVHEGRKPFKCELCEKDFLSFCELESHFTTAHAKSLTQDLNVLTINVCGIECNGRLEQVRLLLIKYKISIAVLTETETTHSYAASAHMKGFRAFCPPLTVTGPSGKETGVIVMVSEELASSSKLRPNINGCDTLQSVWVELSNQNLLIGGVYRRNRPHDPDLEREELD